MNTGQKKQCRYIYPPFQPTVVQSCPFILNLQAWRLDTGQPISLKDAVTKCLKAEAGKW